MNEWLNSTDGKNRFYFANNDRTYYGSQNGYEWRSSSDTNIMSCDNSGNVYGLSFNGVLNASALNASGTTTLAGYVECQGSQNVGAYYFAGTAGLQSGTDYPVQSTNLTGFLYWGGGLNSGVVVKNVNAGGAGVHFWSFC